MAMSDASMPLAGRPARLAVGVISAGRVGAVLGAALARAGHLVIAASAVSGASTRRAAALLPEVPLHTPDAVAASADLVLLAVPDDVLPGLVRGLVATDSLRAGQIVVHTSGSRGVDVLAPATALGVLPLALHPVMTFTGRTEDLDRLATCCVGVTARPDDEAGWSVGEALVVELGAEPVRVPESARMLYHTALAHGANHLITLINDAAQVLHASGVEQPRRLLAPLLSAALDNALRHGDRALTGPVARGDAGTVAEHLRVLDESAPEITPSYRAMSARTAARAVADGQLPPQVEAELTTILNDNKETR